MLSHVDWKKLGLVVGGCSVIIGIAAVFNLCLLPPFAVGSDAIGLNGDTDGVTIPRVAAAYHLH
jgi:hypothetical protein